MRLFFPGAAFIPWADVICDLSITRFLLTRKAPSNFPPWPAPSFFHIRVSHFFLGEVCGNLRSCVTHIPSSTTECMRGGVPFQGIQSPTADTIVLRGHYLEPASSKRNSNIARKKEQHATFGIMNDFRILGRLFAFCLWASLVGSTRVRPMRWVSEYVHVETLLNLILPTSPDY